MSSLDDTLHDSQTIDERFISFFQDGARMLGLPKSIGEIYGLLYASRQPLTMLHLTEKLQISKGSTSQGLKMLRTFGAVNEVSIDNDRKTYFEANYELKKLVGGFIREEIRPHLKSGQNKLQALETELVDISDPEDLLFYKERIEQLNRWSSRANKALPVIQKLLGQ